jgi:putative membrane protein insertion efficiency factor
MILICFPSRAAERRRGNRATMMPHASPEPLSKPRMSIAQYLARALVKAYRLTLSPLIGYNCRHLPTCSQYADEAIARHGFWAGGWMTLARLSRCHPLGTSGLDFVAGAPPTGARWYLPWRYGRWRGANTTPPQR